MCVETSQATRYFSTREGNEFWIVSLKVRVNGAFWGYSDNIGGGMLSLVSVRSYLTTHPIVQMSTRALQPLRGFLKTKYSVAPYETTQGYMGCDQHRQLRTRNSKVATGIGCKPFSEWTDIWTSLLSGNAGHFLAETWKMLQLGSPSSSAFPLIAVR